MSLGMRLLGTIITRVEPREILCYFSLIIVDTTALSSSEATLSVDTVAPSSSEPTSSFDTPTPSSSINTGAVIGGTISGAIVLMGLVTFLFGFLIYNMRRKRKHTEMYKRYVIPIALALPVLAQLVWILSSNIHVQKQSHISLKF